MKYLKKSGSDNIVLNLPFVIIIYFSVKSYFINYYLLFLYIPSNIYFKKKINTQATIANTL